MTDRDHFAAAALTGLLPNVERYQNEPLTKQAFEIADFMLRERGKSDYQKNVEWLAPFANHDAGRRRSREQTAGEPGGLCRDRHRRAARSGEGPSATWPGVCRGDHFLPQT